jgi:hypothetical protein
MKRKSLLLVQIGENSKVLSRPLFAWPHAMHGPPDTDGSKIRQAVQLLK